MVTSTNYTKEFLEVLKRLSPIEVKTQVKNSLKHNSSGMRKPEIYAKKFSFPECAEFLYG